MAKLPPHMQANDYKAIDDELSTEETSGNMWLLQQKRVLAPKIFFFFFFGKNLSHMVMMKEVADWGFLAFWSFENRQKFRRTHKNATKNLKFGKKWVLTSWTPWNVRTNHHHTSYYVDYRFPIINTNHFVINRCEFYLFLNGTVLFICFMTNLSPMRKLY